MNKKSTKLYFILKQVKSSRPNNLILKINIDGVF